MAEQGFADFRSAPHHEVERAGGKCCARNDLCKRMRGRGHEVGRLEHHAISIGERRRDLPSRDRDREIPRRDEGDDPDRLPRDLDRDAGPRARHLRADKTQRLAGEEAEYLPCPHHLGDAVGERLAFLAREQAAEFVPARNDLVADRLQRVRARLRRHATAGGERSLRCRDRHVGVGPARARIFADDVAYIRRVDVERSIGGGDPFAADKIAMHGHGRTAFMPMEGIRDGSTDVRIGDRYPPFHRLQKARSTAARHRAGEPNQRSTTATTGLQRYRFAASVRIVAMYCAGVWSLASA